MDSIIPNNKKGVCYICGRTCPTESHHVYGASNRKISEKYGLKVDLCHNCHNEPPNGIHHNRENELRLKRKIQKFAMEYYDWTVDDFRRIFGKNYL